ncbi:acyl-CoA dehydrogenase protein [Roseibium aggregatum IAM 12614]|uniref:Acyl-CoA dehydrogenase protein n=1 Tax=Roseibium aggregatum (strain ATCC 25650 / DSM 13394 / JCM 20685 / NBRC 16684 / NCIMB 2208 / IAM 12614 / B1) TaxID=384765 RepID=A0NRM2_ROSAI|nr:acyl-CoA dehydrogenase family protein [Roseibium aggregatum]EAV44803.1 acyl-CoA dehydrogenase protein [Roseibium aggregatum IAM 12614]
MTAAAKITAMGLADRAKRAAKVASEYADKVDVEGRFPAEGMNALKAERLMGVMIRPEFGGEGATLTEIADICAILGQACSATAMTYAMHQIQIASLADYAVGGAWHEAFQQRICDEQLLIASATSEAGIGGNLRNSICAAEVEGDTVRLTKDATVISYGANADAIMVTSRRHAEAAHSDQVATIFLKDQYTLEQTSKWDTLGMRGTCSDGYIFKAEAPAEQTLPRPFAEIAAQSMLAVSHLLWGALWYGIAADAVARSQSFVKAAARKSPGQVPPGALRLAEASSLLQLVKANVVAGLKQFEGCKGDSDALNAMSFSVAMNNVKIGTSQTILTIINHCMLICGIAGYKNGTPFSLGRHLRDAHSAQLMISNDRILGNTSTMLLVNKQDTSLLG